MLVRDDIVEYSLDAHHSEEEGKLIRKKIWKVTAILSIITTVEVLVGVFFPKADVSDTMWTLIKWGYIILTVVKAAYIVLVFMHLGDERKNLRYMILVPYILFILYLVFILVTEASYVNDAWEFLK
ncbi:MAG: cytochrome C oxidase subunit IV family protein [Crocinitomicaceae bacterium]|jgi:cytochrome c oxidase subunit 4|nr:cytochrome C oxidase subunit IV family protein [Crocinitomicaceae bacterium]MBK9590553.1 cytochrome C oxidase subunit IV family protein [Crocinitomicaceae bacterium]